MTIPSENFVQKTGATSYNHTATRSTLDDIVPGYFYRMNPDGGFRNDSQCGNDLASERIITRKLISDSLAHWANTYKIDGFRFDLMGLIDADTILQSYARVSALPGKSDILFEGEGWRMYKGSKTVTMMDQNYMGQTDKIAVFNDELRTLIKGGDKPGSPPGFISGQPVDIKQLIANLLGQPKVKYKTPFPGNNLQYAEAHDDLTMHDSVSLKLGLSDTDSVQRAELAARLRLGNFLILASQGVAFLHSGQESGRTKPRLKSEGDCLGDFVHNSYHSADNINQFDWNPYPEYRSLREFTTGMIGIRKAFDVFRLGDAKPIEDAATAIEGNDTMAVGWSLKGADHTFTMLVNAAQTVRTFDLRRPLGAHTILVNGDRASKDGLTAPKGFSAAGCVVTVQPLTALMLKE